MKELPDHELDRLLKEAYGPVEVSSDFTLRLWRRLIGQPAGNLWREAGAVVSMAAMAGILLGLWSWNQVPGVADGPLMVTASSVRMDLYGNAPRDTLAGSVIRFRGEG